MCDAAARSCTWKNIYLASFCVHQQRTDSPRPRRCWELWGTRRCYSCGGRFLSFYSAPRARWNSGLTRLIERNIFVKFAVGHYVSSCLLRERRFSASIWNGPPVIINCWKSNWNVSRSRMLLNEGVKLYSSSEITSIWLFKLKQSKRTHNDSVKMMNRPQEEEVISYFYNNWSRFFPSRINSIHITRVIPNKWLNCSLNIE